MSRRNVREWSEEDKITKVIKERKKEVGSEDRENLFFPQHTNLASEKNVYVNLKYIFGYCKIL